ncbi:MAG TPA: GNAT family N-acetyltransferase [Longimicrobiales bacterium]|nr:GNAT family N-acetyltransferase [Longimicrobiales bacterium]
MPESHAPGTVPPGEGPRGLSLETARLRVTALTRDALQAWLDGDVERLRAETGAVFQAPPACPPLFGEDLPRFRDRMAERPHELGWWAWLASRRDDARAVGVCGLGGYPDREGSAELGYSVYPEEEGQGYATEASRALMSWVLAQPGVVRVRATVPTGNGPSVGVARKLGMVVVATREHPEVGEVTVYETLPRAAPTDGPGWPDRVHAALRAAGVGVVAYVPDAGHARLIDLCHADPGLRAVPLTSEEEGVGLAAGAWLGGARTALLMQSSGVGNLMNALGMARECAFPVVLLVTMRGEEGETNPWQVPVGSAAADLLGQMGVHVVRADVRDAVPLAVSAALDRCWAAESMEAVLIGQRVIGVKRFVEEAR